MIWYVMIFFHELRKGKVKPLLTWLVDPIFRMQVSMLKQDIGYGGTKQRAVIPFGMMTPSHQVHYWDWVQELSKRIGQGRRIDKENPLTVVEVYEEGALVGWKVIDGNHRYHAMAASGRYQPNTSVVVLLYTRSK